MKIEFKQSQADYFNYVIQKYGGSWELSEGVIILQNEDDFVDLCKIINEVTDDDAVRKKLISQVLIWENVKEDF